MHGRAWRRDEAIAVLESPERRASQSADRLWDRVGLAEGLVVADIGAGTGYFAIPAARRVGPSGKVYAVDLSGELVDLIGERAGALGLPQLIPVRNRLDAIPLPGGVADVVLLANVLHDVPRATVDEAVRLLGPEGQLVNVDWKKEESPSGPPAHVRLSPSEASRRLQDHGLTEVDRWELGPWHYVLQFRRTAPGGGSPGRAMD